jgi:hypothetical protein
MMSPIETYPCNRMEVRGSIRRAACTLAIWMVAIFGFAAQAVDGFASTKP